MVNGSLSLAFDNFQCTEIIKMGHRVSELLNIIKSKVKYYFERGKTKLWKIIMDKKCWELLPSS